MGIAKDSPKRIRAAISHVLAASRDQGHCYLELELIQSEIEKLLKQENKALVETEIVAMEQSNEIKTRIRKENKAGVKCYYSKTLYYDELQTAEIVKKFLVKKINVDIVRVDKWLKLYNEKSKLPLSQEQYDAVAGITQRPFSILTGGPGCGKTTTLKVLVRLLKAMNKKFTLAAPNGRAAQRMTEVIGRRRRPFTGY